MSAPPPREPPGLSGRRSTSASRAFSASGVKAEVFGSLPEGFQNAVDFAALANISNIFSIYFGKL